MQVPQLKLSTGTSHVINVVTREIDLRSMTTNRRHASPYVNGGTPQNSNLHKKEYA